MKGKSHPANDRSLNVSGNPSILDVVERVDGSRRRFVQGGIGATALTAAGGLTLGGLVSSVQAAPVPPGPGFPGFGFTSVPASLAPVVDRVTVPAGYSARLLVAWGDPIMPGGVPFSGNATETAAQQMKSYGAHTDGMHFFPFSTGGVVSSERGVLCANNEYTHEEILHPDGLVGSSGFTIDKCRKSQAAHGVSIVELRRTAGKWSVVKSSPLGRRLTANTPMRVSGPAAGHAWMKSKKFEITPTGSTDTGALNDGYTAYGTMNNCAHGHTPWGTYLTCEENWNGYFAAPTLGAEIAPDLEDQKPQILANGNRYGISRTGFGYRWHEVDPRFNADTNPFEPNLYGWVVEVDPFNPSSTPIKRTALGRMKHESAQYVVDKDNRLAFYMGDDERNEYIYKFVCAGKYNPTNRAANRNLLDSGVLYVARFDSDMRGRWIPLQPGTLGVNGVALRDNPSFKGANDAEVQAKILILTRQAADAVGATMMDRPEWTGARPRIGGFDEIEVYCTLTNNNRRGGTSVNNPDGSTAAGSARPPVDAANPRANNLYGHIIRWREAGKSVAATTFSWNLFVQNGDTLTSKAPLPTNDFKGNIVDDPNGSADYGAPDGLWFDPFGRLWVQTDQAGDALGDWVNIGANCMVCADPNTGMTRRFLTGPPNCEVTGVTMTPDGKTMFVGIQHPGEDSTAANPTQFSNWPQSQWTTAADGVTPLPGGRPRSGVVVITKDDGGLIGS
ncbi:MAG: PhoX family phosphatase [Planctomycetes bacterium]|nr:PhoX family phosphatase [Planctomycetota bacterium]